VNNQNIHVTFFAYLTFCLGAKKDDFLRLSNLEYPGNNFF
jgi:hypothetical protein